MAEATTGTISTKTPTITDCPICLEEFRNPKYLPCMHTYCETCLKTYVEETVERNSPRKSPGVWSFSCPICRKHFSFKNSSIEKWISELPQNQILLVLMKDAMSKGKVTYNCDPCDRIGEDVKATHWCRDCSDLLCLDCLTGFHKRTRDATSHVVIDISTAFSSPDFKAEAEERCHEEYCGKHEGKPYEAFCIDHTELCCVYCLVDSHRSCADVKKLKEVIGEFSSGSQVQVVADDLKLIGVLLLKIIEKREQTISSIKRDATSRIQASEKDIDRAITKLVDLKSKIKADVSGACDSEIEPMKNDILSLYALHNDIIKDQESLFSIKQKGDTMLMLFAILQTRKSFAKCQAVLTPLITKEVVSMSVEVSFEPWLLGLIKGHLECFHIKKVPLKTVWKDNSKLEIAKELKKLDELLESIVKFDGRFNLKTSDDVCFPSDTKTQRKDFFNDGALANADDWDNDEDDGEYFVKWDDDGDEIQFGKDGNRSDNASSLINDSLSANEGPVIHESIPPFVVLNKTPEDKKELKKYIFNREAARSELQVPVPVKLASSIKEQKRKIKNERKKYRKE